MRKPVIAIIGRPNVGKSAFFNFITGKKVSIVDNMPGITRDRIYEDVEWRGKLFAFADTGGLEVYSTDSLLSQMRRQAEIALELADIILFMVDAKDGVTGQDHEIADMLRKFSKPILLIVNKVDNIGDPPPAVYEFYNLGIGSFHTVSAAHGLGIGEVLDEVYDLCEGLDIADLQEDVINVAVVGKPNAGKSSLINKLLGEERLIVSDIPGTTREAIDTYYTVADQKYCFIDTAGLRKRGRITDNIERYSTMRSLRAVDRADVVLMLIDASEGISEQDTKIAGYSHNQGKACVIVVNKWDLIEKDNKTLNEFKNDIINKLSFMQYAPIEFISAKTGLRVKSLIDHINKVSHASSLRISTGMLNDVLNEAIQMVQPPSDKGKRLKVYYLTQVQVKPPTFVIFCNDKDLFHYSYLRYIENQLRRNFDFEGTPIVLMTRERKDDKK